jgi:hypothetical protein
VDRKAWSTSEQPYRPVRKPVSIQVNRGAILRRLPAAFRLLAVALGGLHTWAAISRFSMNSDGIAYLDMADAYMRGDWQMAINPVWSPLYAWVLGPVMRVVQPTMRWEFAVVQLVNFAIYLGALACFEFYWRQVMHFAQTPAPSNAASSGVTLPGWSWPLLGYVLFTWTALSLIEIWAVTPDMLLAALVYLAAGLILRIRQGWGAGKSFAMLGMVLGLAFLAKAVMFPLALILLVISLLSAPQPRRMAPLALGAFMVFMVFSVPYIAAISQVKGRLTLGEAGRLTYVRYVNGVVYPHWQGLPPETGVPLHPSRKILSQPPIYEFATPIGGTYPISYDPSYWYEGAAPQYTFGDLANAALRSGLFYYDLFFRQQGALLLGVLVLYAMSSWPPLNAHSLFRRWGLAIFALAAFGLYALVYVEGRYVGAFVTLLWGDLLGNIRLPDEPVRRRLSAWLSGALLVFMLMSILAFNLEGLNTLVAGKATAPSDNPSAPAPSWPGEVAEELHKLGIQAGDSVAVIGYGFDSYWARLARVRIVAELLDTQADPFWAGDAATQAQVTAAFATSGARAIVAEDAPNFAVLPRWHRVGDTNYFIYLLDE